MIFILKSRFLLKNTEGSFDVGLMLLNFGNYGDMYRCTVSETLKVSETSCHVILLNISSIIGL